MPGRWKSIPPSWRRDLTREIDLVEEVARIHGYDKIPEDVSVPMAPSHRTRDDRVLARIRQVLCAAGFDEAMTLSAVDEAWSEAFSPWTDAAAAAQLDARAAPGRSFAAQPRAQPARGAADERIAFQSADRAVRNRPRLPAARRPVAARRTDGRPHQRRRLPTAKGVVEGLLTALNPRAELLVRPTRQALLDEQRSAELRVRVGDGEPRPLGFLGELSAAGSKQFDLRAPSTACELNFATLVDIAELVPQYRQPPVYPAVSRDLNLVVDESVLWDEVAQTVRAAAAPHAESVEFQDVYRDAERLGPGKKSLLLSLILRSPDATLTGQQADEITSRVVAACAKQHAAKLRA